MRRKHASKLDGAEKTVRDIRRATRKHHAAEEKIRIVLEGLRGEDSIAELCRREGIAQSLYYKWSKGCCQSNANQSPNSRMMRVSSRQLTPLGQSGGPVELEIGPAGFV